MAADLGKMAVGQWRKGQQEELQKLCMQVLGAARLAVGMPAVDPNLANTMNAMQKTWASAMQGEIEPAATLLLQSKSSVIDAARKFGSEVPMGFRTEPTEEETQAATRLQGVARGASERRRQRALEASLAAEDAAIGPAGGGDGMRVQLLSSLVSSLSVAAPASNPRKSAVAEGEVVPFDPRAKLRSATRSIAMGIAAAARLGLGAGLAAAAAKAKEEADVPVEPLPEVVDLVAALVDDVCANEGEVLRGYTVRLVGAKGLAPRGGAGGAMPAFLPPPDVNAFAVVYVNGVWAGESSVALQTVAPQWNIELLLRGAAMLHGAEKNSVAVALFDYSRDGQHAFLGQVELTARECGSLEGLPVKDAREVVLRPHPQQPRDRVRGSIVVRVCELDAE